MNAVESCQTQSHSYVLDSSGLRLKTGMHMIPIKINSKQFYGHYTALLISIKICPYRNYQTTYYIEIEERAQVIGTGNQHRRDAQVCSCSLPTQGCEEW